jgi:hypothetical protein
MRRDSLCELALLSFQLACASTDSDKAATLQSDAGSYAPACMPTENAVGFGVTVEGQCSPDAFAGDVVVSNVIRNAARTEYWLDLDGATAPVECGDAPARAIILVDATSPISLTIASGERFAATFRVETDATAGNLWSYLELRDPETSTLLLVHHFFDDRFFQDDRLLVGDEFAFEFVRPCQFVHQCYRRAERYRVVDPRYGLDVGEYESQEVTVEAKRFSVYVRAARVQGEFIEYACAAGRADIGRYLAIDVVALPQ